MAIPINIPEQEAQRLLIKFQNIAGLEGKKCALACVDELINDDKFFKTLEDNKPHTAFWYKVQEALINL